MPAINNRALKILGILEKLLPCRNTIAQSRPNKTKAPEEIPEILSHKGFGLQIIMKLLVALTIRVVRRAKCRR